MKLTTIEKMTGDVTYSFAVDGRTAAEVKLMKAHGFLELNRFKGANKPRTDGYFCAACKHWKKDEFTLPESGSTHDGNCHKFHFRARDYGTCCGFTAKTGLFAYNPA